MPPQLPMFGRREVFEMDRRPSRSDSLAGLVRENGPLPNSRFDCGRLLFRALELFLELLDSLLCVFQFPGGPPEIPNPRDHIAGPRLAGLACRSLRGCSARGPNQRGEHGISVRSKRWPRQRCMAEGRTI